MDDSSPRRRGDVALCCAYVRSAAQLAKRRFFEPLDFAKLSARLSWREHKRWTQLALFARKHGLHREAAYWERFAESGPEYPYASGAQALD